MRCFVSLTCLIYHHSRLSCEKRGRSGQYRKQNLIERFSPDIRLPDLREEIAKCERHGKTHDACMVSLC
jgi:hypothetical protein